MSQCCHSRLWLIVKACATHCQIRGLKCQGCWRRAALRLTDACSVPCSTLQDMLGCGYKEWATSVSTLQFSERQVSQCVQIY